MNIQQQARREGHRQLQIQQKRFGPHNPARLLLLQQQLVGKAEQLSFWGVGVVAPAFWLFPAS